jgi:hypothetical protein
VASIPRLRDCRFVLCSAADATTVAHTYKTVYAPPRRDPAPAGLPLRTVFRCRCQNRGAYIHENACATARRPGLAPGQLGVLYGLIVEKSPVPLPQGGEGGCGRGRKSERKCRDSRPPPRACAKTRPTGQRRRRFGVRQLAAALARPACRPYTGPCRLGGREQARGRKRQQAAALQSSAA